MSPGLRSRIPVACHPRQQPAGFTSYARTGSDGMAAAAAGPSALAVRGLDLEPLLQDDGGTGGAAPAQGLEKALRPDQAALRDLMPRIPWHQLDPSPEAGPVIAPGPSRVPGIINALATDVAAVDDARKIGLDMVGSGGATVGDRWYA
jgi:hypothetical protein